MNIRDAYKGNYVSVERWPTSPTAHKITGAGVDDDPFKEGQSGLLVYIQVDGEEVKYRVNRSNADQLSAAWGDETDNWIDHSVTIQRVQGVVRGKRAWVGLITPVASNPTTTRKKGVKG